MTMHAPARAIAEQLSTRTLDVCRAYLSNGRRCGRYWSAGDVGNSRGRSLYVRLTGPSYGRGASGHWTDAATGEHGDLLDLLRAQLGFGSLAETLDEARRFLGQPRRSYAQKEHISSCSHAAGGRLFAFGRPIPGTSAERYLRARGITSTLDLDALRFHPRVYCRELGLDRTLPALLAAVTDPLGRVTGVHRTWLDPVHPAKARLQEPRRALGSLLGNAVRFGTASDVLLAGEGIETVLSLRDVLPRMPMVAAGSANHLGMLVLPRQLRRLYVARDRGRDGMGAAERLRERAENLGIAVVVLLPRYDDFNTDLRHCGIAMMGRAILPRLAPGDVVRFARTG